ncbi:three-Cys-motif partner protein TcmP [Limnothrix redekei]|uniref:Three-Cys-motif partner protein TcmP n=1 Tax=Limnothrix redekei LRLZ20PSL1 TaxID=3112953 RepID=A0ABW7C8N5_9CYAN
MAQTQTGQQYSESTPSKLEGFRYLMSYHAAVCEQIFKNPNTTTRKYIYVDLNCGAGYQPEYKEFGTEEFGSPIIALQELNKKNIKPICHFCDQSQEALNKLSETIKNLNLQCDPHYWTGDNKESLKEIAQQLEKLDYYGLVYSDPNGKQDFPLKEIKEIFQLLKMKKVDLLMNVATTYVKRWESNPKANWEKYSLDDLVNDNGKSHIFIRQPQNPSMKWTFIYATNWARQKELKAIHLYKITGRIGRQILDHLFSPSSNPPPHISNDGSISIQTNLFDDYNG